VDANNLDGDFTLQRDGSVVIADTLNQRIRRVDPAGIVTTIAGTGIAGQGADGLPAAATQLWDPLGITTDAAGRIVFADYFNATIRRIEADGTVRTIVGAGPTPCGAGHAAVGRTIDAGAYFGRAVDSAVDSRGRTYVVDTAYNQI